LSGQAIATGQSTSGTTTICPFVNRQCPVFCVAGRSTTTPTTVDPRSASTGIQRMPAATKVFGWRGPNNFSPSVLFPFFFFCIFSFFHGAAVEFFSGPRPWPPFGSCFATSTNVDRDSWGRWRALVVELAVETKFIPAQRNTFGSGTSLKDLQILARGCDGTWLPRIPGPDRTQSCRDCIGERWGACAGGGQIVQCPERGPRGMAQSRTEFFSRAESKPGPPYAFPTGMKRSWGSYPG